MWRVEHLLACPEDGAADPDVGGTQLDRMDVVARHAHADLEGLPLYNSGRLSPGAGDGAGGESCADEACRRGMARPT